MGFIPHSTGTHRKVHDQCQNVEYIWTYKLLADGYNRDMSLKKLQAGFGFERQERILSRRAALLAGQI